MTVRLRGHHLLCLLAYKGEGYSPAFIANLDRIAARLTAGEDAVLVDGPDDICAPLALTQGCSVLDISGPVRAGSAAEGPAGRLSC